MLKITNVATLETFKIKAPLEGSGILGGWRNIGNMEIEVAVVHNQDGTIDLIVSEPVIKR